MASMPLNSRVTKQPKRQAWYYCGVKIAVYLIIFRDGFICDGINRPKRCTRFC